jgi:hypothetical protein
MKERSRQDHSVGAADYHLHVAYKGIHRVWWSINFATKLTLSGHSTERVLGDPVNLIGREPVTTGAEKSIPIGRGPRAVHFADPKLAGGILCCLDGLEWTGQFFNQATALLGSTSMEFSGNG